MITLGIETSCDETAIGIVEDGRKILANVVASQSDFHKQFGGVYPEMAARQHVDAIIPSIESALQEANLAPQQIDLIAVTKGPGLIGPLLIGLGAAKTLSLAWDTPFIGVNHVEAHLYAAMLSSQTAVFPSLGVVLSGGHTFLVRIHSIGDYELIGTTVDDAIGEAFDKVASLLDLPYPGGPHVEALAKQGDATYYPFKAGKVKGSRWDFSFSGLKTNVLYTVKGQNQDKKAPSVISDTQKAHVAASFQEAACSDVVEKALAAASAFECKAIYLGGGACQNKRLRTLFARNSGNLPIHWPTDQLCLDNGVMIAGIGAHLFSGKSDPLDLEPQTRIPLARLPVCEDTLA